MEETQGQKNNLMLPIGIAVVVLALIAGGYVYTRSNSMAPTPTPEGAMMQSESTGATTQSSYKDGVYSVTGNYTSPGGPEDIAVSLTLKDGVVTDSTVVSNATRPESVRYQKLFVDNYKSQVVGKSLDSLVLDKVSGSSLAPKGFNDAVEKVKAEAKA